MATTKPGKAAAAAVLLTLALLAALQVATTAAAHNGAGADPNDNPGAAFFAAGGIPWFGGGAHQARPGAGFFGGWGEGGLGYRRGAVVPPSTVCPQDGPCRGKRLTCPPRCFRTFSYGGKNGGGGGGGGGCSFDCTTRCAATC